MIAFGAELITPLPPSEQMYQQTERGSSLFELSVFHKCKVKHFPFRLTLLCGISLSLCETAGELKLKGNGGESYRHD